MCIYCIINIYIPTKPIFNDFQGFDSYPTFVLENQDLHVPIHPIPVLLLMLALSHGGDRGIPLSARLPVQKHVVMFGVIRVAMFNSVT